VTVLDTAGRMVRMNEPCALLTGLSLANAIGLPFVDEFLEEGDRSWVASKLRDAVAGLASGPHETAWRAVGGSWRRVSWTLRPLQGPTGEIQYLIVSGQDVTDQRAMEKALLSSEIRYREMVENSLGFVFTCSMEGRITSLNAFTAETLGYRPEDLVGRMVTELMDATGVLTFQDCLNTLETGEEWQGALLLRRSDGVYRRVAVDSRSMQLAGERSFVIMRRDGAACGRGSAAPGHAATRTDSGVGGRWHLRHRPGRQGDVHQRGGRERAGIRAGTDDGT
jgi:PAS domain S-box-containing protein